MFAYDKDRLFVFLRSITLALPYIAVAVLLAVPFLSWRKLGSHWRTPKIDQCIVALLSLALGCGLIVNLALKGYSGPAAPPQYRSFRRNAGFRSGRLVCWEMPQELFLHFRRGVIGRMASLSHPAAAAALASSPREYRSPWYRS